MAILAVSLSSWVALLAVEVGLRLFGPRPVEIRVSHRLVRQAANANLGFELNPGATDYLYEINQEGLRDRDYSTAKASDTFRIAVLGDSIPYGDGVELRYTFPKLLERYLDWRTTEGDVQYEVLNFGVNGYGTFQEVELLRTKVARFQPDLVVFSYCLNDPDRHSLGETEYRQPGTKRSDSGLMAALRRTRVFVLLNRLRVGRDGAAGKEGDASGKIPLARDYWKFIHDDPRYWNDVADGFRTIGSGSVPAVVVIFPLFRSLDAYEFDDVHAKVAGAAEANGIGVIDLLSSFARLEQRSPGVYRLGGHDDLHPNALGHNIAAVYLLDYVVRQGLIPDRYDSFDWERIREFGERFEAFAHYRAAGLEFENRRSPEQAIEAYERAHAALPEATEVTYWLVNVLRFTGQNGRARTYAEKIVDTDPRFAPAWFSLASIELAEGNHAAAADHFLAGLEIAPHQKGFWGPAAKALFGAGREAEAGEYLELLAEQGTLTDEFQSIRDAIDAGDGSRERSE